MRRAIARRGDAELVEDFLFAADGDGTELRLLGSGYPLVPAWDAYFRGLRDASRQALADVVNAVFETRGGVAVRDAQGLDVRGLSIAGLMSVQPFEVVAEESKAVRERVGFSEASNFAKYKVSGPGSAAWLQGLFTNTLPKIGRTNLTAMLNPEGKIVGEFSVSRIGDDEFFLFGSQAAEVHHPRWFLSHLPKDSEIRFETLSLSMVGLTVAGPRSRDVLQKLTDTSLATKDFPFMAFRRVNIGMAPVWLSRMTYSGDLGYEIWVGPDWQRALFDRLTQAGAAGQSHHHQGTGEAHTEHRDHQTPAQKKALLPRGQPLQHPGIDHGVVEGERDLQHQQDQSDPDPCDSLPGVNQRQRQRTHPQGEEQVGEIPPDGHGGPWIDPMMQDQGWVTSPGWPGLQGWGVPGRAVGNGWGRSKKTAEQAAAEQAVDALAADAPAPDA